MWRPEGLLVSLPVIVFSFTVHPYFLGIFNQLQSANFPRMQKVTDVVRLGCPAVGAGGFTYSGEWGFTCCGGCGFGMLSVLGYPTGVRTRCRCWSTWKYGQ